VYPAGLDRSGRTFGVGSYGLRVTDADGRELFLTAAHVVGSLSPAHGIDPPEVRLQIGVGAAGSGDPVIGRVVRSSPEAPTETVQLDASLVLTSENVTLGAVVRSTVCSGRPRHLDDATNFIPVFKRGMRSGLASGLLDPTPVTALINLAGAAGQSVRYEEGWWVEGDDGAFARPGDSGAIVVDEDDCVIGMVVAVDSENPADVQPSDRAFVISIADLIDGLEIALVGPDRPCTVA
jgi:hypothetical protein